jgi:nitric oxide reductase subunit B
MLVLAIIAYAMPQLTGRKLYDRPSAAFAFWTSNIGMIAMTLAFGIAGVTQVALERRMGMDFLAVQEEIEVHFWGLIMAATLFTLGITAFIVNFIQYGLPKGEVTPSLGGDQPDASDEDDAEADADAAVADAPASA